MDETTTRRTSPRIIRVPPPDGLTAPPALIVILTLVLLAGALAGIVLGLVLKPWVIWLGVASLLAGAVLVYWWTGHKRRCAQRWCAYLAGLRERGEDPVSIELATQWQRGAKEVPDEGVKAVLAGAAAENPPRARIVCLGKIDVPEISDAFFEPEIVPPTRYFGYQLIFVPIALAVIAFWLLQVTGVIPIRRISPGSFGYVLFMGVGVGIAWFWRAVLRPTYIRMAPGIIQVLEYRYRAAKPIVRSYPMDAETLVVLRGKTTAKRKWGFKLTLLRGEQRDLIEIWRMRGRDAVAERTWQALLSTAPTPPLSDEELVG